MRYYKTNNNEFYAYEDDLEQSFIDKKIIELGLEETTKEYVDEYNTQKAILNKEPEKAELAKLKQYLLDTDYMVIKCNEMELNMKEEYPDEFVKRQEARDRINELSILINSM